MAVSFVLDLMCWTVFLCAITALFVSCLSAFKSLMCSEISWDLGVHFEWRLLIKITPNQK